MDNFEILKMLKTAPTGQMDEHWLQKCKEFDGTEEDLMKLFEGIYHTNDLETSPFIRSMVNPKFTKGYMSNEFIEPFR